MNARKNMLMLFALALPSLAGCGNSDTQENPANPQTPSATADESQAANDASDSSTNASDEKSTNGSVKESRFLKQALIDVTADLLKQQQQNITLDEITTQVENGIAQIRKDVPEFLMVSAEFEKKMQEGSSPGDATERIAKAESFLDEFGIQRSGLVTALLQKHKDGKLSAIHTELLAQLIVADKRKAEAALGK